MNIGYSRVSINTQNAALQETALQGAGCDRIFSDTCSGSLDKRKGLAQALACAQSGDVIVVWKLDRLGRSLRHLIDTVRDLDKRSIGLRSLTETIDTTTSGGKLVFHLFGAIAEFERDLIRERTKAGLAVAKSKGRVGGRPVKMTAQKLEIAKTLLTLEEHSIPAICKILGISRATLYRHLNTESKKKEAV
jgi:DNA invertase Pin-like site-specific DNA recombinase